MQRYLSILRGINVSGQKRVKMAELIALYESLGFRQVRSYIQSGNIVFTASVKKAEIIAKQIEQAISRHYGFDVPVILRTRKQLNEVINSNPFLKEKGVDPGKLHVTFMDKPPKKSLPREIQKGEQGKDRYIVMGSEVFLNCPGGYGKTRFSNTNLEKLLGVTATTRNWKTVNVLSEMLSDAEMEKS